MFSPRHTCIFSRVLRLRIPFLPPLPSAGLSDPSPAEAAGAHSLPRRLLMRRNSRVTTNPLVQHSSPESLGNGCRLRPAGHPGSPEPHSALTKKNPRGLSEDANVPESSQDTNTPPAAHAPPPFIPHQRIGPARGRGRSPEKPLCHPTGCGGALGVGTAMEGRLAAGRASERGRAGAACSSSPPSGRATRGCPASPARRGTAACGDGGGERGVPPGPEACGILAQPGSPARRAGARPRQGGLTQAPPPRAAGAPSADAARSAAHREVRGCVSSGRRAPWRRAWLGRAPRDPALAARCLRGPAANPPRRPQPIRAAARSPAPGAANGDARLGLAPGGAGQHPQSVPAGRAEGAGGAATGRERRVLRHPRAVPCTNTGSAENGWRAP